MTSRYLPASTRGALSEQLGCAVCGDTGTFERDHKHPLALGGGNEPDNLQRLCIGCHARKTRRDIFEISKAKRIARKRAGTWRKPKGRPMQSRGFDKRFVKRFNGKVEART